MAATPEAKVKRSIREMLRDYYVTQPTTGGYGRSGQLDFTCCIHGMYVGIEAKSIHSKYGKNGPTALQWQEIDAIQAAGGIALSIDETNLHAIDSVIDCLLLGAHNDAHITAQATLTRHTRPTTTLNENPVVHKRGNRSK